MPEHHIVKRGEIYDVDWGGASGKHPALIIQNDTGNIYSDTTIVAYISHTKKDYPVIVNFEDRDSSLPHGGGINLSRIMTILKSMLGEKKGHLSTLKMKQVDEAIKNSLGIE